MKQFFLKQVHKKRLNNAFNFAGLFYTTKYKGKPIKKFPRILDVRLNEDKDVYVFKLPHSVDPNELKKKEYVFKSMFGENVEFKFGKVISFTVYKKFHNEIYGYNFELLKPIMKKYKLPIIVGKDANGKFICYDMTTDPHILIGGTTGSGKSNYSTALITSWIQFFRKGEVKLYLADLKMGDFHVFRHIDIVEKYVVEIKKTVLMVKEIRKQITERSKLLDKYSTNHIDNLPAEERKKLSYSILFIDEFMLLSKDKETMELLIEISALGRALGVFVILSTQKPDARTVDTRVRSNLTVRMGFKVKSKSDSIIILGTNEVDCSKIKSTDKGKFYIELDNFHFVRSPFLPSEDKKDENGLILFVGAKTILRDYEVKRMEKRDTDESGRSGDVLEGEFRVIEQNDESFDDLPTLEGEENEQT